MAKPKVRYVCQQCGYESAIHLGKCPECGGWSTFVQEISAKLGASRDFIPTETANAQLLSKIELDNNSRISTSISELNRVLGGGLVQGSLVLIAGDPGIGKSTLLLQTAGQLSLAGKKVLYVSAEESANQVKLRADRLGLKSAECFYIYPQTALEYIRNMISEISPTIVIIDSIQAIYTQEVQTTAGSVSQIRECCNALMQIAKTTNVTFIVVGHVTKEGNIAGPKILEHMVDTVIQFEGDKNSDYRILRAIKNRFGNTSEVGIFEMTTNGLKEIINPSELFLKEYSQSQSSGSSIIITNEGTRPLLVEIQALVGATPYPSPRRVANGVDFNRLLQILAVMEKRVGLSFSNKDVYLNVIGGLTIEEPAADLGIALAVIGCQRDISIKPDTAIIGEIGLAGEIRSISNIERRISEAQNLGFKHVIIPASNKIQEKFDIELITVKKITDAITAAFNGQNG